MTPFPHQLKAVSDVQVAIADGVRRICLQGPTGSGKTLTAKLLIEEWTSHGLKTIVYTNRRMLIDQLSETFTKLGLDHGIRAAGHEPDNEVPLQISSAPTENARVIRSKEWELYPAQRVLVDESHLQSGDVMQELCTGHIGQGAHIVGMTATPIDIGHMYDTIITAGSLPELRACGLLVPAKYTGPDEPDMRAIKKNADQMELTEPEARRAMGAVDQDGRPTPRLNSLYGRVWKWYQKLNAEHRPTILFAPGVKESLWFAEQFTRRGVRAAHLDGQDVWIDGEFHRTSPEIRKQVLDAFRADRIQLLANRFVCREGIDLPLISHVILATVFGSLQSFLQSVGRSLRAAPGKTHATIQCHGGNWWRWGSPNSDREWNLDFTAAMIAGLRADEMREKKKPEPLVCPNRECCTILGRFVADMKCPECGYVFGKSHKQSRPVVTFDGDLREMTGDIFRPRTTYKAPNAQSEWNKIYWGSFKMKEPRTFREAEAYFAYKHHWQWPPRNLELMPMMAQDWYRLVPDVPRSALR